MLPLGFLEMWGGNVHLLLALAIVVGFRYPAAWAFVLLTKVTPGVGLLWFAVRREWRSLAVAVGVTALIAAGSWLVDPAAWMAWLQMLTREAGKPSSPNSIPIPLVLRLAAAALVVTYGARTDRRSFVPIAAWIALPNVWLGSVTMLIAVVALQRERLEEIVVSSVGRFLDVTLTRTQGRTPGMVNPGG
jgi:hypothetical protein